MTVSSALTLRGAPAVPRLACTLVVGGRTLRPVAQRVAGARASCTWRLPAVLARTRASGSLVATVAGNASRRPFAFRFQ